MKSKSFYPERVLMTADTVGGVWTYSIELAAMLGRRGIRVLLATMGAPLTIEQVREAKRAPDIEVFESDFKLEWMENPWQNVALAGEWLLRLEEYLKPDIVHLNGYSHGSLPWSAPSLVVGHSCVLSWWEAVKGGPVPSEWDRYRQEVRNGLEASDAVVAPTKAMLDSLNRHYDFSTPGSVIYNGRDQTFFQPGPKEEFVFTAGRLWDEAKNIELLQAAADSLKWPVFAAGHDFHNGGGFRPDGSMRMLGQLSQQELAGWLSKASIFVLPALYEPFGLTPLEAGLSGCALVLGDIPSLREIWEGAALFIDPFDIKGLKDAVKAVMEDPGLRQRLSTAARSRALEFSPERMAGAYLDIYETLLFEADALKREDKACGL